MHRLHALSSSPPTKRTRVDAAPAKELLPSKQALQAELQEAFETQDLAADDGVRLEKLRGLSLLAPDSPLPQDTVLEALLGDCDNFGLALHVQFLVNLCHVTEFPGSITVPNPRVVAHMLHHCPGMIDIELSEFNGGEDGEYAIPVLEAALTQTNHLQRLCVVPDWADNGIMTALARGLASHRQLKSLTLMKDDPPEGFLPVLKATLSVATRIERLALAFHEDWTGEQSEELARRLHAMPALTDLTIEVHSTVDWLISFDRLCPGNASRLERLEVSVYPSNNEKPDPSSKNALIRRSAQALLNLLPRLPCLKELHLNSHVYLVMPETAFARALRKNPSLRNIHVSGLYEELPASLSNQLAANRALDTLTPPEVIQMACKAMAVFHLGLPEDIGNLLAESVLEAGTPAQRLLGHGLLSTSKKIYSAARQARVASLRSVQQQMGPHLCEHIRRHCERLGLE